MDKKVEEAINEYQCPGCSVGPYLKNGCTAFKKRSWSESCDAHSAGTSLGLSIKIFLGMPKGFNRTGGGLGDKPRLSLDIFKSFDEVWTELNQANMSWTPRPTNERNLTSNPTILTRTRK